MLHETAKLACNHLSIDSSLITTKTTTAEDLVDALTPLIANLLNSDMERLLNALYRIDVDEEKVKLILATEEPDAVAHSISKLVIEREMQKVSTRIKYRNGN